MKKYRSFIAMFTVLALLVSCGYFGNLSKNADAAIKATLASSTVRIGKRITIKHKSTNAVKFRSENEKIASVSSKGVITGKRAGTVKIYMKYNGVVNKVFNVKVVALKYKPVLPVTIDQVVQSSKKMTKKSENSYTYSAVIKNNSASGNIKKIQYVYDIEVAKSVSVASGSAVSAATKISTAQAVLTAKNIKHGKSKKVACKGDYTGKISAMKLVAVRLYTGKALYKYTAKSGKYSLGWSGPDKTAPVFSGLIKKRSYTSQDIYRTCYSDKKSSYNFKQFVSATDDRGKVKIKVDTSKINWSKSGVYKIYYTAKDKAGNKKKTWAKIQVYVAGSPESAADTVLKRITKKSWSNEAKARAIYRYVKKNCAYVEHSSHKKWRTSALQGLRYQSGDCYTHYAISRLLLTRAGIPNMMIKRYPTTIGRHYWNLVYVHGGWYHLDTTKRSRDGKFCLVTDSQLRTYSTGLTFRFTTSLYPARAVNRISPNP